MEEIKQTIFKLKERNYVIDLVITLIFLIIMLSSFYFCVIGGRPNLIAFILVVIGCFTIIVLFLARHLLIGLVMMVIGGLFGFFTDFWGTGTKVFVYRPDIITSFWLLRGITTGVPLEIVASYFFASMWLMQIIESIFDREIEDLIKEYDNGQKLLTSYKQMIPALVAGIVSIIMISLKPVLIQPWGYFTIGVTMTCLVPGTKKIIPISFGVIVGLVGVLFELFCTGSILPEAVIWYYTNQDWGTDITYRAFIAYAGVGAAISSTFLILLKYPIFRKEFSILSLKK